MISIAAMSTYAITIMIFESVGKGIAAAGRLLTSVSYGEEDGRSMTAVMKTIFTKGSFIALEELCLGIIKETEYQLTLGINVFTVTI